MSVLGTNTQLVKSPSPPPFVLVHGGRHGGGCWRKVSPLISAAGHRVYSPTLTGLGERSHLLSDQMGLDTHVQDVVAVFEYEDVDAAILVTHSYAGMVVSGAMERIFDRVSQLVFLDAHMPAPVSRLDQAAPEVRKRLLELAAEHSEGWFIPPSDASYWGATDTISVSEYADPAGRLEAVKDLTGGMGAEIVVEVSGARTAFPEGLELVRRGGRFVVIGQVGPHEVTIRPARLTAGQLTILGSFSAETRHYWRAMEFLSRSRHKFDFDRLISNRYHLDEATVAMAKMKSLEEIKPVVLPTLAGYRP